MNQRGLSHRVVRELHELGGDCIASLLPLRKQGQSPQVVVRVVGAVVEHPGDRRRYLRAAAHRVVKIRERHLQFKVDRWQYYDTKRLRMSNAVRLS